VGRDQVLFAAQLVFALSTFLMLAGIIVQVFYAGAEALVNPNYFNLHRSFAHLIELLPLVMLVSGLVARVPRRINGLSALLFGLFILQYVFLYATGGWACRCCGRCTRSTPWQCSRSSGTWQGVPCGCCVSRLGMQSRPDPVRDWC
jgi:hypothetical protein